MAEDIKFYDYHLPILKDGTYAVSMDQSLTLVDNATTPNDSPTIPSTDPLQFRVAGPRFKIKPSMVHSVFPPKGGRGDYRSCLPTIALNRSTLPWERSPLYVTPGQSQSMQPTPNNDLITGLISSPPWLYLLLIEESEIQHTAGSPATGIR